MKIESKENMTINGMSVCCLEMMNCHGASVRVTNFGARVMGIQIPDKKGDLGNVVVGYPHLEDYFSDPFYMGAIVGRVANRMKNASFDLDGKTWKIKPNDGPNCNHGGATGFHQQIWQWQIIDQGVRFSLCSPHGEGGWPGTITATVDYIWSDDNVLTIIMQGTSDRATFYNPTCHAYFNLSATQPDNQGKSQLEDVLNHEMQITAREIVGTDSHFIPTGDIISVEGTPFDFSIPKTIGHDICQNDIQLLWNRGYNHCYVIKKSSDRELVHVASLRHLASGRTMDVLTTLPGLLVYSAGFHDRPSCAVCFETQFWPDFMHHPDFPQSLISPDQPYHSVTKFHFNKQ